MRILLFLSASLLLADDAKAPEITTAQQLDYRRAQVEQLQAQAHMTAVVESMQKTCGERPVITDAKGDPICGEAKK